MERLVLIVDQLEEIKSLIQRGDISHLRIALLLLDNASEVLMFRAVTNELFYHDARSRIFTTAQRIMPAEALEVFKQEMGYEPLSEKERRHLLHSYEAKVDFLSRVKESRNLPEPLGRVLKTTHRYRNEAYHRDRLRKATLRPVVMVLFDIVTDLFTILSPGSVGYSSNEDWSEFCRRYGFEHPSQVLNDGGKKIVETLKAGMRLDTCAVASSLSDHLVSRLDDIEASLEFLSKDSGAGLSPAGELRRVQFWKEHGYVPQPDDPKFQRFLAPRPVEDISCWRLAAERLRDEGEKLLLFGKFSDLEAECEPLEEQIHEAASSLDESIQLAIDIARGK